MIVGQGLVRSVEGIVLQNGGFVQEPHDSLRLDGTTRVCGRFDYLSHRKMTLELSESSSSRAVLGTYDVWQPSAVRSCCLHLIGLGTLE